MPEVDRRRFLQLAGGTAALSVLTPSIARAASIPANRRTGSLADVEHIVVLMQENRAFDHYYGTLRGVRGYGDPHPAQLPNGASVWRQPNGKKKEVLPFRPDAVELGDKFLEDLDHGWPTGHQAFNAGRYDDWVAAKGGPTTMAHLQRSDIPFHYALADAFTICDAYHCSLLGATNPNRYYMWTGWVGNDGKGNGPGINNLISPAYSWTTYPERLQEAGIDWRIYQDIGAGTDAAHGWGWDIVEPSIGNYGDNALLYFESFQNAVAGDPLYDRARVGTQIGQPGGGTLFDQLQHDVSNGTLPQVSWIVAPEGYTEHPNWPPNYGAWYVSQVLDALTSDPDVWSKTALFLTYDENDGFFDHVVPPYPNVGTLAGRSTVSLSNELYSGKKAEPGPYGLGVRVPMTVISPWSTGGWVCSEVFDHTSIIRFIEQRFGVHEPHITPWRRAVCGDLTSAFDFAGGSAPTTVPTYGGPTPPAPTYQPDYVPKPPKSQAVPKQEPGVRPSRALGYRHTVDLHVASTGLDFTITNNGRLGAQFQARSNNVKGAPFSYTLGAGDRLEPTLKAKGRFDVSFFGPNGFFRRFAGDTTDRILEVRGRQHDGRLVLTLHNRSKKRLTAKIADAHRGDRTVRVAGQSSKEVTVALGSTNGWYDVLVTVADHPSYQRGLAGRFETGKPSTSDPLLGR